MIFDNKLISTEIVSAKLYVGTKEFFVHVNLSQGKLEKIFESKMYNHFKI